MADRLTESSDQQSTHIQQVVAAIDEIHRVTQQSAASSEENAAVAEELSAQSETMKGTLRQLATLVDGEKSGW